MVKLEVFSGDPPCPGCVAIIDLAKRVAAKYPAEELELTVLAGAEAMEKFEEYQLFCVPAAVVNGKIRIEGMCPSEATLNNALREGGLCLK
ncbi:MAG: thioredoxin family protein [Anaerolineae bacterium]|jgi:predicted DsbA family dithiol-disulfide isomerase|nr:thioredoxin family protein [Anaerolineae bacterium]